MTVISLGGSGRPKRDFIEMAFEELGSAGYEFERTSEEVKTGLRRLNLMMTEWPWNELTYDQPVSGDGAPTDLSTLPDEAASAVSLELANRLAGLWRTLLLPEQKVRLARAKGQLFTATPPTQLMAPGTVRGSGARGRVAYITEEPT